MPTISPEDFSLGVRLLLAVGAFGAYAVLAARWHLKLRRDNERLFEQTDLALAALRDTHELACALQTRVEALASRLESETRAAEAAPATAPTRNYDVAVRLARGGASAEELVANCGIAAHEAQLLTRLHGRGAGAGSAPRLRVAG